MLAIPKKVVVPKSLPDRTCGQESLRDRNVNVPSFFFISCSKSTKNRHLSLKKRVGVKKQLTFSLKCSITTVQLSVQPLRLRGKRGKFDCVFQNHQFCLCWAFSRLRPGKIELLMTMRPKMKGSFQGGSQTSTTYIRWKDKGWNWQVLSSSLHPFLAGNTLLTV